MGVFSFSPPCVCVGCNRWSLLIDQVTGANQMIGWMAPSLLLILHQSQQRAIPFMTEACFSFDVLKQEQADEGFPVHSAPLRLISLPQHLFLFERVFLPNACAQLCCPPRTHSAIINKMAAHSFVLFSMPLTLPALTHWIQPQRDAKSHGAVLKAAVKHFTVSGSAPASQYRALT